MLELTNLAACRDGRPLFAPISVAIARGEVVTCMGPSGLGKSSLLQALVLPGSGLSLTGEVRLDGQLRPNASPLRGLTQTVLQDPLLFPHLSVGANVGLSIAALPRQSRQSKVSAVLDRLGLGGFASRDPVTLSRGQRMRVSLARALVAEPQILLLDEPFSALDADLREHVKTLVFETVLQGQMMAFLVTHQEADRPDSGAMVCLTPYLSDD